MNIAEYLFSKALVGDNGGGGGGDESVKLIYDDVIAVSTTSTTTQTIATILPADSVDGLSFYYAHVYDTAGMRNEYFYGTESWLIAIKRNNGTFTLNNASLNIYCKAGYNNDALVTSSSGGIRLAGSTTYPYDKSLTLTAAYSATLGTMDGNFRVKVYEIKYPNGDPHPSA